MNLLELPREQWLLLRAAHATSAAARVDPHLARRACGERHPIDDFLWDYYPFSTGKFRLWNPGATTLLLGYTRADGDLPTGFVITNRGARCDLSSLTDAALTRLQHEVGWVRRLLSGTRERTAGFGCFGLHEWAMLLGQTQDGYRHQSWPLRVTQEQIAATVDEVGLRCTHFDAWRFFTPESLLRNPWSHSRESQPEWDQGGCLHANMDLYKWSMRLQPLVASDFVMRAFDLALRIRQLDMAASPYDFRHLDVAAIAVETPDGRVAFARQQREFAREADELRAELLSKLGELSHAMPLLNATLTQ